VLAEGEIKVSDKVTLWHVSLVQSLGFNLHSVSHLLDEGFEVLSRPGGSSRIFDSRGDLVCMVILMVKCSEWISLSLLVWLIAFWLVL
jgi:hypothetical protein